MLSGIKKSVFLQFSRQSMDVECVHVLSRRDGATFDSVSSDVPGEAVSHCSCWTHRLKDIQASG